MSLSTPHRKFIYSLAVIIMAACYGCSSHKTTVQPHPVVTRHVNISAASAPHSRMLLTEAEKWLGTPYKYGGTTRGEGVDCSGLVMSLYSDALSIKLPRNSAAQAEFCNAVERDQLEVGDLIFFAPRSTGRVNHVGMYIGNGDMIHASGSRGVMISSLNEAYFVKNFYGCGRVEQFASLTGKSTKKEVKNTRDNISTSQSGPTKYDEAFTKLRQGVKTSKTPAAKTPPATKTDTIAATPTKQPSREMFEEAIDQRVDSICSAFFD